MAPIDSDNGFLPAGPDDIWIYYHSWMITEEHPISVINWLGIEFNLKRFSVCEIIAIFCKTESW